MMRDDRDYKLDLSSVDQSNPAPTPSANARPFLSVQFNCCKVYCRIYRNLAGDKYEGRCPRCGKAVTFKVGPGGTDSRFFTVE